MAGDIAHDLMPCIRNTWSGAQNVCALCGVAKLLLPLSTRSLLERIDFSDPFVILIQKSNLTSKTRIWTWRRRKKVLTLAPQKAAMSGEFGAARLGFSKYALILAISNEKTGFQGPKFSVLRPPPPLGSAEVRGALLRGVI